jgi:photosystem II stability/assembly factor-like uncharacterized protein
MFFMILFAPALLLPSWTQQISNTTVSLRGLAAVSENVAWASGTKGTYLLTTDGGEKWIVATVPGAEALDFRDVAAFSARSAYLLSSGTGNASRVYKTSDGGSSWKLLFSNPDPGGFFDALSFWDERHGLVAGDPVNGHFVIFTTSDGGVSWQRETTPPALAEEGAFAASGSCLVTRGTREAWFATGGPAGGRVFRSSNRGKTWHVSAPLLRGGTKSSGLFSLAFRDAHHGIAVGGDYQKPEGTAETLGLTSDGGKTWKAQTGLHGFRSGVVFLASGAAIAVGTSGSEVSNDNGKSWQAISADSFNAVAAYGSSVWAVGARGTIAKLVTNP